MRENYLFSEVDMYQVIEYQKRQATERVQQIPPAQFGAKSEDELVSEVIEQFRLDVPRICQDKLYVAESVETQVDVRWDPMRFIRDRSQPFYVPGFKTTIAIPFEGDPELFKVQPNQFSTMKPMAQIAGREIRLTYEQVQPDAEAIKNAYTKTLQQISGYLESQRSSANDFNSQLAGLVRQKISERKQKAAAGAAMVGSLGLPTVKPD